MTEHRLSHAAAACFLIGLGLIFLVDEGWARAIGVPLAFVGIALGVTVIASPGFLEGDREARDRLR